MKLRIQNRFGIVPNHLLNDDEISFKAKGLFAYLQSKPDDWDFSAQRIAFQTKDGADSVSSGLRELEDFGYLLRKKFQNEKGHWEIEYILSEEPNLENPVLENPAPENPDLENPETYSKKDSSKKEHSKQEEVEKFFEDEKLNFSFIEFQKYRKEVKRISMTSNAINRAVIKISRWLEKYTIDEIVASIENSMDNDYQGIFEPKRGGKPKQEMEFQKSGEKNYLKGL